jgi:hypothetical protein
MCVEHLYKLLKDAERAQNLLAKAYFGYLLQGYEDNISREWDPDKGRRYLREELDRVDFDGSWRDFFEKTYNRDCNVRHIIELTYF